MREFSLIGVIWYNQPECEGLTRCFDDNAGCNPVLFVVMNVRAGYLSKSEIDSGIAAGTRREKAANNAG